MFHHQPDAFADKWNKDFEIFPTYRDTECLTIRWMEISDSTVNSEQSIRVSDLVEEGSNECNNEAMQQQTAVVGGTFGTEQWRKSSLFSFSTGRRFCPHPKL